MTSDTEARKSVAMTCAPRKPLTPVTSAVSPLRSILAPSRASSCTCMKRFSKMVSRTSDVPLAVHIRRHELRLQIGGEAREGLGLHRDGRKPPPFRATLMPVGRSSISTPDERERLQCLLQEIGAGPVEQHVAAGDGRGHGVGPGLDPVGQHGVLGAVQGLASLDPQG